MITISKEDEERFFVECKGGKVLDCRPVELRVEALKKRLDLTSRSGKGGAEEDAGVCKAWMYVDEVIPHVMGILNVTPDSFYDGGKYNSLDSSLTQARQMIEDGAAIIDIGAESTRPKGKVYGEGASVVDAEEELARLIPVIQGLRKEFPEILISVDTYKPSVADKALEAGANIINDVTGLRLYPEMADVAVKHNAPIVLMHALGKPGEMPHHKPYKGVNVVDEVYTSLASSINVAEQRGVKHIITDVGFGFGKDVHENLCLVKETEHFLKLRRPNLIGLSNKSSVGSVLSGQVLKPRPAPGRICGSLGVTTLAVLGGASIIRAHNVRETIDYVKGLVATMCSGRSSI
eukprot:Nk52_evm4s377 gene=Nk52_evmTU4s377